MSHSDEPPKRTLIGQDNPFQDDEDPADTARQPIVIPPGSESTLPLGSTSSLREALNQALAEGPAVAAARIQAARAAEVDASSTAPMGSAAIEHAATALDVPPPAKPLAFTARGTAPSQSQLAEAIAKAANAHAERSKTPSSPLGEVAPRTSDPSIPRKPTTPGAPPAPAVSRTPTPGSPDYGTPMNLGAPSVATPTNNAPGYGAPVTSPTSLPADSMFARQKPATGPNPAVPSSDPRIRPPTGPNPAVAPSAFTPRGPTPGTEPTAINMQAPRPNPASPYGLAPSAPGTERTALDLQPPYRPPTGPNPAVDPSRGRPPTGPTGTEPTAINMQAPPYNAAYDPSRGRPPTGPAPLAQGYDARAKPPTGPNPVEHTAKPGNPNVAAYPQSPNDPNTFGAKPGTNPNVAVYPQHPAYAPNTNPGPAAYAQQTNPDPNTFGAKPGTNPNVAAYPQSPNDPNTFGAKPGTNPNVAVYPQHPAYAPNTNPGPYAQQTNADPNTFGAKPGTNPNVAAYPQQYPNDPNTFGAKPGTNPNVAAYPQGSQYPDPNTFGAKPNPNAAYPQHSPYSPNANPGPAVYTQPTADPNTFGAKPGTNPNVVASPQGSQYPDPNSAKPGTNPNVAAYPHAAPTPAAYAQHTNADPNAFGAKPGSSPGAAAYVAPHDATMMASPASQMAQLSPAAERPRVVTDPLKPISESLREVLVEHYDVQGEIARGGMGRILHAHDRRLDREVAIKELIGNSADFKARFERETLITARLQHPAIVPVYDAGRWPTGELFYTMKLVRGKPLELLIEQLGPMRDRIALVPNMIAVAEALAFAHSNRIVHRDLKPANILIGSFGETIVIDWGLAKDLSTNEVVEPAGPFRSAGIGPMGATVAGSVMGTPAYMPVEQGRGLQVDARADVYAIGAVLYHVLSKRAPYEGPDGMSILQALLKEPPPPLAEIAPDVPPELATIVAKAMAREADARYPTANELVADLRRYQNGQMVGVHRYTSRELFKRWAKKHKGALTVATIAFVALVVVGVIAISRVIAANREAQREAAVALDQTETAQRALARAEASEFRAKKSEQTVADERDRQRFARERRVEFDHFAHTQRVSKCAECHPTDPKTFTALEGHPGHAECQGACHEHEAKLMEGVSNDPKCAFCHIDRVSTTKDHVSLRACDDSSMRAIKAMGGKVGPCFRHDSKPHRIADDGKPLECTTCHAVLADKSKWGSKSYTSLQDLDTNTIIGQGPGGGTDAMHKACSTGCHAHEAETSVTSAKAACAKCHPQRGSTTF